MFHFRVIVQQDIKINTSWTFVDNLSSLHFEFNFLKLIKQLQRCQVGLNLVEPFSTYPQLVRRSPTSQTPFKKSAWLTYIALVSYSPEVRRSLIRGIRPILRHAFSMLASRSPILLPNAIQALAFCLIVEEKYRQSGELLVTQTGCR